jgi:hypothetical protein
MINVLAEDVDTMVVDQPNALPEQSQEMCRYTQWPQPLAPDTPPQILEPCPQPRTQVTDLLCDVELLVLGMAQKPRPAVQTQQESEVAKQTMDVDMEQQRLCELAGGDILTDILLPDGPLPDVPLPDDHLPIVPLPNVPVTDARQDGLVGEE